MYNFYGFDPPFEVSNVKILMQPVGEMNGSKPSYSVQMIHLFDCRKK